MNNQIMKQPAQLELCLDSPPPVQTTEQDGPARVDTLMKLFLTPAPKVDGKHDYVRMTIEDFMGTIFHDYYLSMNDARQILCLLFRIIAGMNRPEEKAS